MIKAVVFDFFGVLTTDDTRALEATMTDPAAVERILEIARQNDLGLLSEAEWVERLAEASGRTVAEIKRRFYGQTKLNPEVLALTAETRARCRTALLSNASPYNFEPYWPRSEMERHFDVVVISAEVGLMKPDPAIYRLVCQRLGVAPAEAVFIDDVARYVAAAQATGMAGIVFTTFDQASRELAELMAGER